MVLADCVGTRVAFAHGPVGPVDDCQLPMLVQLPLAFDRK